MNVKNLFKNVLLASHPVGSIFITTDGSFDPHAKWGGTWQLLEDSFLVGAGNTYTLGASGGSATATLDLSNLPPRTVVRTTAACTGYSTHNSSSSPQGTYSTHCLADAPNEQKGQSFNILPPYTAVNMWLRTA